MADKSTQLVLEALSRAATEPAGVPLYGSKSVPGLFAATAPAKEAAQRCKESDYLRVLRSEARGKTTQEICTLTDKGLSYLLSQASPKQVLEELVRAFEARRSEIGDLVASARHMQASLDALRTVAERVMHSAGSPSDVAALHAQWRAQARDNGTPDVSSTILAVLDKWHTANVLEDCPLAELYRRVKTPALTIGQFHDALRRLVDQAKIYLHPWTGPLSELPEPPCALMVGHEIAYYASIRK